MTVSEFLQLCIDDFFETIGEAGLSFTPGSDRSQVYEDLCILLTASKCDRFYVIDFSHIHTDTIMHMITVFWSLKKCEIDVLYFFKNFLK